MPRPATGQVVRRESGVWALRFRACGARQYQTLGTAEEGWTRQRAEQALRHVMADVERGTWRPPHPEPASEANPDPSFHEFASEWFEATKGEWREKTRLDYEWQLAHHLLPFFRDHRLSQITAREIDRYRQGKVAEGKTITAAATRGKPLIEEYVDKHGRRRRRPRRALSATSINKTITRLGQILEVAVEYGLIAANPAKSRRRRLKAQKALPVWLDRAEHIKALLDAAGELDRQAKVKGGHDQKGGPAYRRALLATLVFAGLRIGELTALQWRDIDLAENRITVRMSKTDAGVRQIDLLPALRNELDAYKSADTEHPSQWLRVRHDLRHRTKTGQHPPSCTRQGRGTSEREAVRGGGHSAAGRADTPQAAPHVCLDPRRAWRRSGQCHGPARAHRPQLHPACLPSWDAPRRCGQAATAGACQRPRLGSSGQQRGERTPRRPRGA